MKRFIAVSILVFCILSMCSCVEINVTRTDSDDDTKQEQKSEKSGSYEFDIEKYAAENGYTAYYTDVMNPIRWLLVGENKISEVTALAGVQKENTIPLDSVADILSSATAICSTLTVTDKSGGSITVNLSEEDCREVIEMLSK